MNEYDQFFGKISEGNARNHSESWKTMYRLHKKLCETIVKQKRTDLTNGPSSAKIVPAQRIIPVSYTHLDVYKRQALAHGKAVAVANGGGGQVSGIDLEDSHVTGVILAHHGGGVIAVSYTHLFQITWKIATSDKKRKKK